MKLVNQSTKHSFCAATVSASLRKWIMRQPPAFVDGNEDSDWHLFGPDDLLNQLQEELDAYGEKEDLSQLIPELQQLCKEAEEAKVEYLHFW